MAQPVLIGLIAALAVVAGAIFTLIGVLLTTRTQFRLGSQSAGIQQQTVDIERIDKLSEDCRNLRIEIAKLWDDNRNIRAQFETVTKQQEHERKAWAGKRRRLIKYVVLMRTRAFRRRKENALLKTALERAEAERDIAINGQVSAEGGLLVARQTLQDICPPVGNCPATETEN